VTSENPISENNPEPNACREPDKQPSHPEPEVAPAFPRSPLPPTKAHGEITCKTKRNWWDRCKPFAEIVGIVLLAIYTGYTIRMYGANRDSADAAKSAAETAKQSLLDVERSLAATSAAECAPILDNRGRPPYMSFRVGCQAGKVDAVLLGGSLQITLINPRTNKATGHKQTFTLENELIPPGKQSRAINVDVENFSKEAYLRLAQAIIAEGFFAYDDGFARKRSTPFCLEVIPYLASTGVYDGMQTVPCDLIGDTLRRYEQQENEQKHK
jgi:hypothetical protein